MIGLFVRIPRGGHWVTVDIDELSEPELDAFILSRAPDDGWRWFKAVVKWVQTNVQIELRDVTDQFIDVENHDDSRRSDGNPGDH